MPLVNQLSNYVATNVRRRGKSYFEFGQVEIGSGDANTVRAIVEGTDTYYVSLQREGDRVKASCTCPYFQDSPRICKHIWATVLAAEKKGYLQASSLPKRLVA